ncbi:hypothetical protein MRX96_004814 [Rhipicephalus microplus]|uniref:uncharacterized protein LOC119163153 isoform X2 n=1 Tax=Rhipicephalus microplus TaxID=6941 RepID=UPI001886FAEC|nr:uncharacterized protein LOC119163153 isoform X2 [Rhipicephalus microplus]
MQAETLTTILVIILGDIMIFAAGVNIKQFVNQFELLWTYKTTNRAPIKCEVDHLLSIKPMSITFKRSMFIRGSRCDFRIHGVFDKEHKERMTLFYKGHLSYYDLRVRNSSVHERPLEVCRTVFKGVTQGGLAHRIYNAQCQQLIRQEK